jgi:hypothetical protein
LPPPRRAADEFANPYRSTRTLLAVVEYIGWYDAARLHESLGDIPPLENERATPTEDQLRSFKQPLDPPNPGYCAVPVKPGPAHTVTRSLDHHTQRARRGQAAPILRTSQSA